MPDLLDLPPELLVAILIELAPHHIPVLARVSTTLRDTVSDARVLSAWLRRQRGESNTWKWLASMWLSKPSDVTFARGAALTDALFDAGVLEVPAPEQRTAFEFLQLVDAAQAGRARAEFYGLAARGVYDINNKFWSALCVAARQGHAGFLRFVLRCGASHDTLALFWAVALGHIDCTRILLEAAPYGHFAEMWSMQYACTSPILAVFDHKVNIDALVLLARYGALFSEQTRDITKEFLSDYIDESAWEKLVAAADAGQSSARPT